MRGSVLVYSLATIALASALRLAALVFILIPVAGPLIILVVYVVCGLAAFMIWLVLLIKAFQGEMFELPLLGSFAAQRSNPS